MKNVLVFWINGMLGECLFSYLEKKPDINLYWTLRKANDNKNIFSFEITYDKILTQLDKIFSDINFDYVVNCIVNISKDKKINDNDILVNSIFPQILKYYSHKYNFKIIHISTNWVFTWIKWDYTANDIPNNFWSSYGITKILWEVVDEKNITIRTSIIGIEKWGGWKSIINWLLSQEDWSKINGYTNAYWNWITTLTLSKIIYNIIFSNKNIIWILHISWENYSKYDLISFIIEIFWLKIKLIKCNKKNENITILENYSTLNLDFKEYILPIKKQLIDLKNYYYKYE